MSEDAQSSQNERDIFFGEKARLNCTSALLSNCTLCLIKPHILLNGQTGKIIDKILEEGFEISSMQTFFLERNEAEGFFELYKGIHPEYNSMIDQCISGPMIALEIRQENAVNSFKQICGMLDPVKGRT